MKFTLRLLAGTCLLAVIPAVAQSETKSSKVTVHGSIQADVLFPEEDVKIGTGEFSDKVLGNAYANAGLFSKYVDAGVRVEYLQHPLPGFDPDFKGWGLGNIYAKGKYKGLELTVGDFYEQFGSGFILRTYEERSLGVDNSIRGGRLKVNAIPGVRITALGGVQRDYWDWNMNSLVYGGDVEWDIHQHSKALQNLDLNWTWGASYVLKHEKDSEIIVPGTNNKLNLPKNVSAFDVRTHIYCKGLDLNLEYAWKSQDPSFNNNYTYGHGNAIMASVAYSKPGWSAFLQAKRSYNMSFRSRRSNNDLAAFINNMPAFTYQHTYTLAAMYPYATQAAPGEWAFQGAFAYSFKKGTPLGGKYGTKFKLNASYICGLGYDVINTAATTSGSLYGTEWHQGGTGGFGSIYYTDVNLQMDKKINKELNINLMYMFQKYNKTIIEGHGGMINSNIFVAEGKYKFNKKYTLRGELQYLQTKDDQRDWLYGQLELSVLPYLMFTISDQWNCGSTGLHYYLGSVTASFKGARIMAGYGRTRAGYNCSGGVCRYVPASRGFQMALSYNF